MPRRKPSTEVACPHFPACPGCPWVGRPYARQLADKLAAIRGALTDLPAAPVEPVVPAPARTGYRVQAKLMVAATANRLLIGLYAPGTHRVVDVSRCPLHDPLLQRAIPAVRDALVAERFPIHGNGRRGLRYLLLRASVSERRLLVTLVTSGAPRAAAARLARRLRGVLPLAGVLLNENTSPGNVILGPDTDRVWGAAELRERYGEVVLAASPLAFVQANTRMAARIYAAIAAAAALRGHERVVDLYCGVGGIALALAPAAASVLGIEEVAPAVRAARANARRQGLHHARFEAGRVEEIVAGAATGADLVTLNPPRKGCHPGVVRALAAARVPRLLYLSCAVASFARDAAALVDAGYRLTRVQPFDLLPQTEHVELLGSFTLTG